MKRKNRISEADQEMLSQQVGFIPVISNAAAPHVFEENNRTLLWKGWAEFLEMGRNHESHPRTG